MKPLNIMLVIALLLFTCAACNDNFQSEALPEEETEINAEQRDAEIKAFLNNVSNLETKETKTKSKLLIGTKTSEPMNIGGEYYIPTLKTYALEGFEQISADRKMTSFLDVIWPGNIIQGNSVNDVGLSVVPLNLFRKPGVIYLSVISGKNMNYSRNIDSFTASNVNIQTTCWK